MKRVTSVDLGGCIVLGVVGSVAVVVLLVVAVVVNFTINPVQRVGLRLFPPGTPVPVSVLPEGPPADGPFLAASTSLDALRKTVLKGLPCPAPPRYVQRACWGDFRPAPGMLLVATVGTGCRDYEWDGWTSGSTLTIELVTWFCAKLTPVAEAPEPTYALLGVPLSRLPRGRLAVGVRGAGVAVTVP